MVLLGNLVRDRITQECPLVLLVTTGGSSVTTTTRAKSADLFTSRTLRLEAFGGVPRGVKFNPKIPALLNSDRR